MQRKTLSRKELKLAIRILMIATRLSKPRNESEAAKTIAVKLTIKETAMRLKVHTSTLFRWRKKKGKLQPIIHADGDAYYIETHVNEYLLNKTARP